MIRQLASVAALATALSAAPVCAQAAEDLGSENPRVSLNGDPHTPNISGLWLGSDSGVPGVPEEPNRGSQDGRPSTFWQPWPIPYTPEYQAIYEERLAAVEQGRALGDDGARCRPFGLTRMLADKHYPDEIVQTPGQVTFFMFGTFPVTVWTYGRGHPEDFAPSYNGHSIGYWVGDTLFVDTVGLIDRSVLASVRTPLSGEAHVQWTVRRVMDDMLHINLIVFDEVALTEPATTIAIWTRKSGEEWAVLDDQSCFENASLNDAEAGEAEGFLSKF